MKNIYTIIVVLFGGMAMLAACQKDRIDSNDAEGVIMLITERFSENDTKTSVKDASVQWENYDYVWVNSNRYFVTISGGKAYIDAPGLTGPVYSYFGYKGFSSGLSTAPNFTLQSQYTTRMSGGRQIINLPMAAYSAELGESITFKHISAAVKVMLKNSTGSTLYVDEVVVKTNTHRINGAVTLDLTDANLGMASSYSSSTEADRKVKVCFGEPIAIPASNSDNSVQVPILPISGDALTIEVKCHTASGNFNYSKTLSEASELVTLARNEMLTARLDINTANATTTDRTVVDLSSLDADYTAQDGDVLTGTLAKCVSIFVANRATVTLRDASINADNNLYNYYKCSGITCNGDATLILEGINYVHPVGEGGAGIFIPENYTLIIQGDGTLNAYGGAAIGAGNKTGRAGNIVIAGGTIVATTPVGNGAGIGASNYKCGNITITGGNITADGNSGIGSGCEGQCGDITITGGTITASGHSGIGSGGRYCGQCGNIIITGGEVTATGVESGAAIGCGVYGDLSGMKTTCGSITITSGVTRVTATKGADATWCIGGHSSYCGTVTIGGVTGAITTSPYTYPALP